MAAAPHKVSTNHADAEGARPMALSVSLFAADKFLEIAGPWAVGTGGACG